ncbi:MAG: methylmalonyl Co-A mutase-associated GTPase MeaB [Acidobacteria bacterium]|nr:methylmalonyl Co-A mutase-associated GTPase MeaB [Acidobacteriota bacterium]
MNTQPSRVLSPELWEQFRQGSRIACARLVSLLENRPDLHPEIRHRLFPLQRGAVRIGITGPPGVGKSTVTSALTRQARVAGHTLAVIAVDPTSPFSGGAFLGDRIRMQDHIGDPGVFIRSLASRDGHGGLSPATPYAAEVFDAFGMDWILIETVGVGQAELDVLNCVDIVILVLQPGTGDIIQALKAGIMEAGDIFLINKADQPGVDMVLDSLRFIFQMDAHRPGYVPPPLLTAAAHTGTGMSEVFETVEQVIAKFRREGRLREKRRQRLEQDIREYIQQELWHRYLQLTDAQPEITRVARELTDSGRSPFPYIEQLKSRIRMERNHDQES